MPSRKQRRRREKLHRHEYEYVVETEEGEVPVERPRERERAKRGDRNGGGENRRPVDRRGRPVPEPSLQRVLKRAAIFGPLLVIVVFLTQPNVPTASKVFSAAVLLAFFIPFSYMVDVLVYRALVRRQRRRP